MHILYYDHGNMQKHILYMMVRGHATIQYVHRLFPKEHRTELVRYKDGKMIDTLVLNYLVKFDKKKPLKSIENFLTIMVIG